MILRRNWKEKKNRMSAEADVLFCKSFEKSFKNERIKKNIEETCKASINLKPNINTHK